MKRTIIKIDEELCDGCGLCVVGCHEGALQVIDGKARLTNESYCDGLGACIGECPQGAISFEEREAEGFIEQIPAEHSSGCPSMQQTVLPDHGVSQLRQWPVQLHLLNPQVSFLRHADVVLAADCVAYAYPDFHQRFLKNRMLAIACPKLDSNKEVYVAKLVEMIDNAQINSLSVIIMEVPCCGGLVQLARLATAQASRSIPVRSVVVGIEGGIVDENVVTTR